MGSFYSLLKTPARLALHFYCRKIVINKKEFLQSEGPLLIACNHPNSFLDAVIFATIFKNPVNSLTRGDAFVKRFRKILTALHMLPIYRLSEGSENLETNYSTFNQCIEIFRKKGIVLIFAEGGCINEWHLRPLKKGPARLALSAWRQNIPLKVLPAGINYNTFRVFGKNVILNFGELILPSHFDPNIPDGQFIASFNAELNTQLKNLVFEIDKNDKIAIRKTFCVPQPLLKKLLLFIPAIAGAIIHLPLYFAAYQSVKNKATDHFDAVMVGLLFIFYPLYLLGIILIVWLITKSLWSVGLLLLIPFTAWSAIQLKRQV